MITGGDSGIGRAVALAFAREGADVLVSYYDEHEDAKETQRLVESAGRQCMLMPGDIKDPAHCRAIISQAVSAFGRIDVLVNNAAHQASFASIEDIGDEEWDVTFRTNVHAMFYLTKAAVPHMQAGGSIINTASINADTPSPNLLAYAITKGAIQNFSAGLAQLLAERLIRVNCVAPGPIWTPLIPSTMPADKVSNFGKQVPMQRPGQPRELAPIYVLLAADEASYMSGATSASSSFMPPPLTVLWHRSVSRDWYWCPLPVHEKAHDRPHRVAPSGKPAGKRSVGRRISGTLASPAPRPTSVRGVCRSSGQRNTRLLPRQPRVAV